MELVPFLFSAWDRQSDAPSLVTGENVCFIHLDNACMKTYGIVCTRIVLPRIYLAHAFIQSDLQIVHAA